MDLEALKSLSPSERIATINILTDIMNTGTSKDLDKLYYKDFIESPITIDEFMESDRYAGWFTNNGKDIYPYWKTQLRNIFSGHYSEAALTGSIGIGKSTIAVIGLSYLTYKLMCLRDPHDYYNIGKGAPIYIVFFNTTLQLSQGVAYTKYQNLMQNSPWFMEKGSLSGKKYVEYLPDGPIRFTVGSQIEHSLGKDIFAGMLDEVNFAKGADVHMEQSKIMKTYNNVLERMSSRFMVNGKIAGTLFLVSSKKSEHDFVESYIQKKKNDPTVYVADAALWEVKPAGTYSGKTFSVAVGSNNLPSRIMDDDEDPKEVERQGYSIIHPPLELKNRFEMDLQAALMNIAGISISYVTKFIPYTTLVQCYNNDKNPFVREIIESGLKDKIAYKDFFVPELVPSLIYTRPLYIHIDASLTGDITGIGCCAVMGYRDQDRYNDKSGEIEQFQELVYKHVFSIGIKAPKGDEISLQKTREFIYYLKHVLGWNIKGVSLDGFQSADTRQQLEMSGFNASIVSLDKTDKGYLTFKAALQEKRISMLNLPYLEDEIIHLERNNMTGKVDHPLDSHKDVSDGIAGALYNAFLSTKKEDLHYMDNFSVVMSVNDEAGDSKRQDNPANDLFSFSREGDVKMQNNSNNLIDHTELSEDMVNQEVDNQLKTLNSLRSNLTKAENAIVKDEDLLEAMYNRDSDIIIF